MPRLALHNRRLTGKQTQDFRDALIDAYGTPDDLDLMLQLNLDKRLADLSLANDMPAIAFDVINKAESQAWSRELLGAALKSNPNHPELLAFSQQFDLASSGPDEVHLAQEYVPAVSLSRKEVQSLRLQLASLRENLRLIEQRKAEYVEPTKIPLTLLKNESRVRAHIAEVKGKLKAGDLA